MSAFGTVDARDQRAVQLTFPAIFQSLYSLPLQYAPSATPAMTTEAGDDFQATWHEQKRVEANRRAMNGVKDTRTARNRYVASPHGYYNLPPTMLAQRRFANPSYGAASYESARRDQAGAPFQLVEAGLQGGVLRTAEGQAWGKSKLNDRIAELDRIDAENFAFQTGQQPITAVPTEALPATIPERTKIEFNLIRQRLIDLMTVGNTGDVALADLTKFVFALFGYAPEATQDELEDIRLSFEEVLVPLAAAFTDDDYDPPDQNKYSQEAAFTIQAVIDRAYEYTKRMIGVGNLSPKERRDASKAFIKSSGLAKFLGLTYDQINRRQRERADEMERRDLDEVNSELDAEERQAARNLYSTTMARDSFTRTAPTREDTIARETGRARLDTDMRQFFGEQSGAYLGEAPTVAAREPAPRTLGPVAPMRLNAEEAAAAAAAEGEAPPAPPASVATVVGPVRRRRRIPPSEAAAPASGQGRVRIRSKADLPKTREGFVELGKSLGIRVYAKSKLSNIRRNFVRKLGLE